MFTLGILAALILALGESSNIDWTTYIFNGGPFAVVLFLIIFDKLTTVGERDRLRQENSDLRSEIKDLNVTIRDEIIPTLVKVNEIVQINMNRLKDLR